MVQETYTLVLTLLFVYVLTTLNTWLLYGMVGCWVGVKTDYIYL